MSFPFFPTAASTIAGQTDLLLLGLVAISAFVLALVFIPMIFFIFKYRRSRRADRRPPNFSTWKLEVTWTLATLGLFMGLYAWASEIYLKEETPPADALEIHVVGKQWMWKIEHPEGISEIDQLHIPVGQTVKLELASQDVIHSFFVPAFRLKQDVVPGRYTAEWFCATKAGTYHLFCSQYCGTDHAQMIGQVIALEASDYQKWLSQNSPGETLAQRGAKLFRDLGCSGCHMGNSVVHAPRLEGLYGKPVPLANGQIVTADDTYIRDCILTPQLRVPAGYPPVMPTFQGHVSEDELFQLTAYIKGLANASIQGGQP